MARFNMTQRLITALVALLVAGILVSDSNADARQECKTDMQGLIVQCGRYVKKAGPKTKPSQECCNVIKNVDVPCACKHITKEVEAIVDMGKVVYVAKVCGKPLAPGSRCGSYTVPPAISSEKF